jgi:DNA-binding transcriptional MerR regulator
LIKLSGGEIQGCSSCNLCGPVYKLLIFMEKSLLPPIPAKRYFTIGEVSELCGVKPHVLRYWEQEFTQLRPMKRRGNRRYYQRHEVLMIRRIRDLLYDQGFTITGARNKLQELVQSERERRRVGGELIDVDLPDDDGFDDDLDVDSDDVHELPPLALSTSDEALQTLRKELTQIRDLLSELQ